MGNIASLGPDGNRLILRRLVLLARASHFDHEEIELLFDKFNSLRVHPSQKIDNHIVSASPISCRSMLLAPELGANVFLQAVLSKYFSSPYRDFLLGRDNRVQMTTVTVSLPPGPLGLQVRAGKRGKGLYVADASESMAYKEIRAGMQLIGIGALNVASLDYDRIISIIVEREHQQRELHFQLMGHDVEEDHAKRELRRIRSRAAPPRDHLQNNHASDAAPPNPDNPYDSDSDWEQSDSILHAKVSAGPINAVLGAGENGYCAQVQSLKTMDFGAVSEVQQVGCLVFDCCSMFGRCGVLSQKRDLPPPGRTAERHRRRRRQFHLLTTQLTYIHTPSCVPSIVCACVACVHGRLA